MIDGEADEVAGIDAALYPTSREHKLKHLPS